MMTERSNDKVNIIPNDSANLFVAPFKNLIERFIIEHLDGPDKNNIINKLNLRIELCKEDQDYTPGKMTIDEDYLSPLIYIYEGGLEVEYQHFFRKGWSFDQFRLQVLFHELSHMVLHLSDIEGIMPLFKSDSNESHFDADVERLCNVMAERYLRRTGYLGDSANNLYFAPESFKHTILGKYHISD